MEISLAKGAICDRLLSQDDRMCDQDVTTGGVVTKSSIKQCSGRNGWLGIVEASKDGRREKFSDDCIVIVSKEMNMSTKR